MRRPFPFKYLFFAFLALHDPVCTMPIYFNHAKGFSDVVGIQSEREFENREYPLFGQECIQRISVSLPKTVNTILHSYPIRYENITSANPAHSSCFCGNKISPIFSAVQTNKQIYPHGLTIFAMCENDCNWLKVRKERLLYKFGLRSNSHDTAIQFCFQNGHDLLDVRIERLFWIAHRSDDIRDVDSVSNVHRSNTCNNEFMKIVNFTNNSGTIKSGILKNNFTVAPDINIGIACDDDDHTTLRVQNLFTSAEDSIKEQKKIDKEKINWIRLRIAHNSPIWSDGDGFMYETKFQNIDISYDGKKWFHTYGESYKGLNDK